MEELNYTSHAHKQLTKAVSNQARFHLTHLSSISPHQSSDKDVIIERMENLLTAVEEKLQSLEENALQDANNI